MRSFNKFTTFAFQLVAAFPAMAAGHAIAEETQTQVVSLDNGDRLVISNHWKIEHRSHNFLDNLTTQLGTKEGRQILSVLGSVAGFNPAGATIISAVIPFPKLNDEATDNRGVISAPKGMTICKAGPVGTIEYDRAHWEAQILRRNGESGLSYYTSVGTDRHDTHRVEGSFYIEFVKATDGWMSKYGCMADREFTWKG